MLNAIYIVGAYGRKYNTAEEVRNDWNANKDFRMVNHQNTYINKSDFLEYGNPLDHLHYQGEDFSVSFWWEPPK